MGKRSRVVVMFGAAAACAGTALTAIRHESEQVRAQVGAPMPVVMVQRGISSGTRFTPAVVTRHLVVRRVPQRFVPPRALSAPDDALGLRATAALAPGDYVTRTVVRQNGAHRPGGRRDQGRLVEVEVAGAGAIAPLLRPGSAVDVLVTTHGSRGSPRTYLALQDVPLAGFATLEGGGDTEGASGVASLRVSLHQAVLLTAAQSFARELRLVPRPPGTPTQPRLQVREGDL